jgi:hypothetical protein
MPASAHNSAAGKPSAAIMSVMPRTQAAELVRGVMGWRIEEMADQGLRAVVA